MGSSKPVANGLRGSPLSSSLVASLKLMRIIPCSSTLLLVYVDDIILAGDSLDEFTSIKQLLDVKFKIKDLSQLKFFVRLEVVHSALGLSLCQRKYCLELLSDSGLTGCKPARTPLDPTSRLHVDDGPLLFDVGAYRHVVGWLLYLTMTRPDISFVTQQLSQLMLSPLRIIIVLLPMYYET